jgi:hypothetical protein
MCKGRWENRNDEVMTSLGIGKKSEGFWQLPEEQKEVI